MRGVSRGRSSESADPAASATQEHLAARCVPVPHLREKLIVIVLKDPHFSLQLPDVVGRRICRGDRKEIRGKRSD